eukprot:TRINITY_DN1015_c0_g1_i1.p2 TRINITY_DN1015_c0_g1~~TRINITY_DN1015_c0_g1_i1.p2  ORF type:complete len:237 (+),score=51.67 TRINITY_DN1015_c0_g1_i1:1831-2541(+)
MEKIDPIKSRETKSSFANTLLVGFYKQVLVEKGTVDMQSLTEVIIRFCFEITKASKGFMEKNPFKPLPRDYVLYPGKLDHITCVCVRVCHCALDFQSPEDCFKKIFWHMISRNFTGKVLIETISKNVNMMDDEAHHMAQLFLGFNFIVLAASCYQPDHVILFSSVLQLEYFYEVLLHLLHFLLHHLPLYLLPHLLLYLLHHLLLYLLPTSSFTFSTTSSSTTTPFLFYIFFRSLCL